MVGTGAGRSKARPPAAGRQGGNSQQKTPSAAAGLGQGSGDEGDERATGPTEKYPQLRGNLARMSEQLGHSPPELRGNYALRKSALIAIRTGRRGCCPPWRRFTWKERR